MNLTDILQLNKTNVIDSFGHFRKIIYKIIKIFCFFIWYLQNMLYICTQITTTKFLSLKNRNYDNY